MTTAHTTAAILPVWSDLSDVDKGAVLLHLHKREWEGAAYAVAEYPARFFDDPALTGLERRAACTFAVSMRLAAEALDEAEHTRLYDLAAAEPDRRCLWGARIGDEPVGIVSYYGPADQPKGAVELVASWERYGRPGGVVVHRGEAGGDWHELGGCDGCAEVTR